MEPELGTRRRCPYCGATIRLGDCPIVATNYAGADLRDVADMQLDEFELPSATTPLRQMAKTRWPVVAEAPAERLSSASSAPRRSGIGGLLAPERPAARSETTPLPPLLDEDLAREDVPARACPDCEFPLPRDIDHRPAAVIAVVGVNRVGKTHLLAASLTEAYRGRGLAPLGCTEFIPDDATSARFTTEYHQPLFRHGEILATTAIQDGEARFRPLVFNVSMTGVAPFSVVMHDIAGEVLGDHRRRVHEAAYLRAARGIIFVVDPRDIDDVRDGLPDWIVENNELGWDQGALLHSSLGAHGMLEGRPPVPLAVVVAKADLLPTACDEPLPFLEPRPAGEDYDAFLARVARTSKEVEAFLECHGAHSVLDPAREYARRLRDQRDAATTPEKRWRAGRVTYHAVSALGSTPDANEQLTGKVRPLNCIDPLAMVLAQFAGPVAG